MIQRVFLTCFLSLVATVAHAETLTVAAKHISGFVDSPYRGKFIELLREVEKVSDYTFKISVLPPARAIHIFEAGQADILLPHPVKESALAESFYRKDSFVFYQCDHSPLRKYQDLKNKKLALTRGFHYKSDELLHYAKELTVVTNDEIALRMVNQGRVDATIGEFSSLDYLIREYKLKNICVDQKTPVGSTGVYLLFSKKKPLSNDEAKINTFLKEIMLRLGPG